MTRKTRKIDRFMNLDREVLATLAASLDIKATLSKHEVEPAELRAILQRAAKAWSGNERAIHVPQHVHGDDQVAVILRVDGASRGNPGPSAAGFALYRDSKLIEAQGQYLGRLTNNQAEYNALILGLDRALELGVDRVTVKTDSELMCRQMNGVYKVKNPGIQKLFVRAQEIAADFAAFKIEHVPREQNQEADRLANRALDEFGA